MARSFMIQYYNRKSHSVETEKVYGASALEWAYQSKLGFFLTHTFFSKKWLSVLMGWYESSRFSIKKIAPFIQNYEIKMEEYETTAYASFNDFFIRKFKSGLRPFSPSETVFAAGAEARYLLFQNLSAKTTLRVKGIDLQLTELIGEPQLASEFEGGNLIIARLCPVDYHRYHFPVSGTLTRHYTVSGELHSVNPVALKVKPDIFLKNERQVAILENPHFGKIAMIEVGALGVGKIIQSAYTQSTPLPLAITKGTEKGYFLFGGSTVIWVFQKNKFNPSADLLENSLKGLETWVQLGDSLSR